MQFDLACIALTRDQRLISTTDPSGHEAAWWGRSLDIGAILRAARADSGDVVKAAAALNIRIVEHASAVQRTEELVNRLDARMGAAQRAGDLGFINREYKRRRQEAQAEGRGFMS